jgi:hypothetical protein
MWGVGGYVDRRWCTDRLRLAAKCELQLAFQEGEHFLELMAVGRRAAAVGHQHVNQAIPALGLRAGNQHGIDVSRLRDVWHRRIVRKRYLRVRLGSSAGNGWSDGIVAIEWSVMNLKIPCFSSRF